MFRTLERIAKALEGILYEVREMRAEQKRYMELAQREAANGPKRILEIFDQAKALVGGQKHG